LLERRDAAGALGAFDGYLGRHPAGALCEEALDGKARALGTFGRTQEGRDTLGALLARFPGSAYAPRARRRLGVTP
jgi:TolA-binding protein